MESVEVVEKYAILMVGSVERPIPSDLHMQKELFILSKIKPSIQEHFNFQKHYIGPFSPALRDVVESSVYVDRAFVRKGRNIFLSKTGKVEFRDLFKRHRKKSDFNVLNSYMKLIRIIYDKLSSDELLFIIYDTYPDYTEFSNFSDIIMKNKRKITSIVHSLFKKGIITKQRHDELKKRYLI